MSACAHVRREVEAVDLTGLNNSSVRSDFFTHQHPVLSRGLEKIPLIDREYAFLVFNS